MPRTCVDDVGFGFRGQDACHDRSRDRFDCRIGHDAETADAANQLNLSTPTTKVIAVFVGDGSVDQADLDAWLAEAGANELASGNPYIAGDANLDGFVDASDFNIWNGNKFTEGDWTNGDFNHDGFVDVGDFNVWNSNKFTNVPSWCSGDFNADGSIDVSDFNIWNANKFQNADVMTVPEPTGLGLLGLSAWVMIGWRRR